MKIKDMSMEQLRDGLVFMSKVPFEDECFSGWNFDHMEWKAKYDELLNEVVRRINEQD